MGAVCHVISSQEAFVAHIAKDTLFTLSDPVGRQVCELFIVNANDSVECLSASKTLTYESTVYITRNNALWSNRSNRLAEITHDTYGRNDILLGPCTQDTYERLFNGNNGETYCCQSKVARALAAKSLTLPRVPSTLRVFSDVRINQVGSVNELPRKSMPDDFLQLKANMDLIIAVSLCAAFMKETPP